MQTTFALRLLPILFLGFTFHVSGAGPAAAKPDILLLMPDQMRGDCLSILGHPSVHTLNLDRMARAGALFRRAYATCPSCIPSRYALLTGLHPATSGVVGYAAPPITSPTLPKLLGDAGYNTVLVGRYMHQTPSNQSYGYQKEIRGSTYVADDDYDDFLKKAAPETGGIRKLVASMGLTFNGWEAKPWPLAENLNPSAWIVDQARQALRETSRVKPVFLTVSFYAPHPPLFPPKKYYDEVAKTALPPVAHGDWVDWQSLSPKGNKKGDRILLAGETLRATQCGYFGQIDQIDDEMESVIEEFKHRSESAHRPWVILFTSDHGEMLGDNGYFRKCEPYEGSANIPFLIEGSRELGFAAGVRSEHPVCLEDIMPMLLELAGAVRPGNIDGVNLLPVLRGKQKDIRAVLHFEHAPCYNQQQAFEALTDGRFKYIWRTLNGAEQLFDLDHDPHEEHDLTRVPAESAVVKKWRDAMIQKLANRPEGFTDGTNLFAGRPYVALQPKARQGADSSGAKTVE